MLVKWTGNDLLAGHATWDDYNEMNRIYKFYHFKFSEPLHAHRLHSQRLAMSSYPGMIFSSDDFYVLDSYVRRPPPPLPLPPTPPLPPPPPPPAPRFLLLLLLLLSCSSPVAPKRC